MRIVHLVSYSLFSGPMAPTLALARAQQQAGHTVWLAIDTKRGDFNGFEEAAAPRVAPYGLAPPVFLTLSARSHPVELWRDMKALRRWCKTDGLDVVHAHLSHDHALMAWAGHAAGCRIRTLHAERCLQRRWGQKWLLQRSEGWIVRCHAHQQLLQTNFRLPAEKIGCIPGSIDSRTWAPADKTARHKARARFQLPAEAVVLGHVALMADRGQKELIEAVSRLAPWEGQAQLHILLVGRGEDEQDLREHVQKLTLGHRVHFAGYLSQGDLQQAYAAMDGAFLAQAGNDASARAALEAMACGLPVLGVQRGALAELVTEMVGYPIPDRSSQAVAGTLQRWLAHLGQGWVRGQQGRRYVQTQRCIEDEAQATLAFYHRMHTQRSPQA